MTAKHVRRAFAVVGVVCLACAGVAAAQEPPVAIFPSPPTAQDETVAVDLSLVRDQVAAAIRTDPAQVPDTVRLPASEAARVCKTTRTELNAMNGPAQCLAQTTSMALDMAARRDAQLSQRAPTSPIGPTAYAPIQ